MTGPTETDNNGNNCLPSFWDVHEYHRTVKRVEHTNKLCSYLSMMIQERASIEKAYSNNLQTWESRWMDFWNSKHEYGSGSSPWRGLCAEASAVSHIHMDIHKVLMDEVHTGLKHWQKEHYHKAPLPPNTLKESKHLEKEFERAQKPWSRKLKKVNTCKKEYYDACRSERSLQVQVQNAKTDPTGTPEQLKKVEEKWKKAEKDVERTRSVYQFALRDLDGENARYLDEMTRVFNQAQENERERLCFFKDISIKVRDALSITEKTDFPAIFKKIDEAIAAADVDADLAWWSSHHGVDMPVMFPVFEEYLPEINPITNKKRSTIAETNNSVTLTGITPIVSSPVPVQADNPEAVERPEAPSNGVQLSSSTPFDEELSTSPLEAPAAQPEMGNVPVVASTDQAAAGRVTGDHQRPDIGGELAPEAPEVADADYYASATYDDGRPGVRVRALYDYVGQEDDEIGFKAGDIFEKLEEADSQGWCKGRINGQAGLYPAKYAEEI